MITEDKERALIERRLDQIRELTPGGWSAEVYDEIIPEPGQHMTREQAIRALHGPEAAAAYRAGRADALREVRAPDFTDL